MAKVWMIAACLAWAEPAAATSFERCSRPDLKVADAAIQGAVEIAMRAAAAVGDTPE